MTKTPDPTDKHVGARIRIRRMQLGLSQSKISDHLGLTFQQVQKYENGSNRVSASKLQRIANLLRVEVSFFFEGQLARDAAVDADAPPDLQEFLADRHGNAIATSWPQVPRHLRATLVAFVEAAANPGKVITKKAA